MTQSHEPMQWVVGLPKNLGPKVVYLDACLRLRTGIYYLCARHGAWRESAIWLDVVSNWRLGGESPLRTLMTGTVSRTARVSIARWNLKKAAGKIPARRTGIAYEAVPSGRGGKYLQSPIVIREAGAVYAAGIWEEGHAHYPGRSASLPRATGVARRRDGLVEVSRGHSSWSNRPVKDRTRGVGQEP